MLLRQWAYFDHEDLWYELLSYCEPDKAGWLAEILQNKLIFHANLRLLCSHGLVEAHESAMLQETESGGYTVHACVHSWMTHVLNKEFDFHMAYTAVRCVAAHVPEKNHPEFWLI